MIDTEQKQRAILYVRVSTKEQVEDGNSLVTQERLCRDFAARNNLELVQDGIFIEEGESAKTAHRTELQKLLKYATLHKDSIDCLLIYRIDRLSRDTRDYGELKMFFGALGIRVISISEAFDDNPVGRFIENTLAGVAQLDNEIRAERSKNGMIEAVRDGRWTWKAPFGYINGRVNGKKNIKPDRESTTPVFLREAWELVDCGYPIGEVHRMISAKGLIKANGKPIKLEHFYKLFRNPIYKGVVEAFGLSIVSGDIQPIIEPALFDRVSTKLAGKQTVPTKYQTANPLFPLRGTIFCLQGHRMTASCPRGNGGRYPKYHCAHCRGTGTSHDKTLVEEQFVGLLNKFEYDPSITDALVTAIVENYAYEQRSNASELAKKKRRLFELDVDDDEIARKNRKGVFTDQHTKRLLATNNHERTNIKIELNQQTYPEQEVEKVIEFGTASLQKIGSIWTDLDDLPVKQRFQTWLFPVGLRWNGENFGTIENIETNLSLSLNRRFSAQNYTLVAPRGVEPLFSD